MRETQNERKTVMAEVAQGSVTTISLVQLTVTSQNKRTNTKTKSDTP